MATDLFNHSMQTTLIDIISNYKDFYDHRRKLYSKRNNRVLLLEKITNEFKTCFPVLAAQITTSGKCGISYSRVSFSNQLALLFNTLQTVVK